MTKALRKLWEKFRNREYRHAYADSHVDTGIATQIQVLRKQRGLSQSEVAGLLGTRQSRISTLENIHYGKWTLSTLKKLAQAFDVALVVRFVPFSEIADEMVSFSESNMKAPAFDDDFISDEDSMPYMWQEVFSAESMPSHFQEVHWFPLRRYISGGDNSEAGEFQT